MQKQNKRITLIILIIMLATAATATALSEKNSNTRSNLHSDKIGINCPLSYGNYSHIQGYSKSLKYKKPLLNIFKKKFIKSDY